MSTEIYYVITNLDHTAHYIIVRIIEDDDVIVFSGTFVECRKYILCLNMNTLIEILTTIVNEMINGEFGNAWVVGDLLEKNNIFSVEDFIKYVKDVKEL